MTQKLKLKIREIITRDARPEEIIAWHQLGCIKSIGDLCYKHIDTCEGCPAEPLGCCDNRGSDECNKLILKNKEIILEVVDE